MDYKGLQERAAECYPYLDGTPIEIVDAFRTGWLQGYMECYSDVKPGEKKTIRLMTQEEKQLLLKDLCARLPYGVYGQFDVPSEKSKFERVLVVGDMCGIFSGDCLFKPYLRPMSSMTEEEKKELDDLLFGIGPYHNEELLRYSMEVIDGTGNRQLICVRGGVDSDWYNARHIDYHGLIEKGLALEAPEDMYKND